MTATAIPIPIPIKNLNLKLTMALKVPDFDLGTLRVMGSIIFNELHLTQRNPNRNLLSMQEISKD